MLRGHTTGVSGDDYHLAFYAPSGYEPERATVNGKAVFLVKQQKSVWAIPVSGNGTPVEWSVKFR